MKAFVLVALLLAGSGQAFAEDAIPQAKAVKAGQATTVQIAPQRAGPQVSRTATPASLPTTVPEQFSPPQEAYASFPEAATAAPAKPSACQLRLAKVATFKPLPVLIGAGECGALDAVILDGVILPDRESRCLAAGNVALHDGRRGCRMAARGHRAGSAQARRAAARSRQLRLLRMPRAQSRAWRDPERTRPRQCALDVRAFKLANGEMIGLTDVNIAKAWRDGIRAGACARFSTVLGPGSDGHHEEHVHVDLAERRGGYKMCEWDVREPVTIAQKKETPAEVAASSPASAPLSEPVPLPRPRPLAANVARDVQLRASRTRAQ